MTTKQDPAEELADLFPEPLRFTVGAEELEVWPLQISQFGKAAKLIRPIVKQFGDTVDIYDLLAEHSDALIEVIAIAIGREATWVGSLRADHFINLAVAVTDLNRDFFARCVVPAVNDAMMKLAKSGDGAT